ncbi:phasin family protein [Bradyrhizobium jicamae]|uniref:phasin family protein n=1 Tax=Bradyrhizobium jicamae TaxID=280332 RepID=UPI002012DFFB|nr:phasin family protein [Bradyrhizobium jicamae]
MSETKTKVTGNGASTNGTQSFPFSRIAIPGVVGDLAERSFARAQAFSEAYSSNAQGAADYGLKVLEISHANAASAFGFFVDLLASKSPTDVLSLSAEHARKSFAMATEQNRELWALGQKLATNMSEPVKKQFATVLQQAR